MNQTENNLLNIALPKWPQMLVSGKPVNPDQAKEIIFRTDNFVYSGRGGNDHVFKNNYKKYAGLDRFEECSMEQFDFEDAIRREINFIDTSYVRNNWGSSCFIYGAHGWCSPQGIIHYIDNVGKWPSVEEILSDWLAIAKEFPFLDLHVTLMNGESCESNTQPLVNIRVVSGTAALCKPDLLVHDELPFEENKRDFGFATVGDYSYERGLPDSWVMEYASRIKKITQEIPNIKSVMDRK